MKCLRKIFKFDGIWMRFIFYLRAMMMMITVLTYLLGQALSQPNDRLPHQKSLTTSATWHLHLSFLSSFLALGFPWLTH